MKRLFPILPAAVAAVALTMTPAVGKIKKPTATTVTSNRTATVPSTAGTVRSTAGAAATSRIHRSATAPASTMPVAPAAAWPTSVMDVTNTAAGKIAPRLTSGARTFTRAGPGVSVRAGRQQGGFSPTRRRRTAAHRNFSCPIGVFVAGGSLDAQPHHPTRRRDIRCRQRGRASGTARRDRQRG